jgi:hypothetical protein
MKPISTILLIAVLLIAGVHLWFYWVAGTVDPCKAAVVRIVQKQREAGRDITAGLGVLFGQQFEDALRSEGVAACYRSALRGEAPEIQVRLNLPR